LRVNVELPQLTHENPCGCKIDTIIYPPPSMWYIKWGITVAPWLQKSPKPKIIHRISGITTQHLVPKEKPHHKIQYSL